MAEKRGDRTEKREPMGPRPAEPGRMPRVISELERAAHGGKRYKVRAVLEGRQTRYLLAKDEASAKAEYLKAEDLVGKKFPGPDGQPADVVLSLTHLPD